MFRLVLVNIQENVDRLLNEHHRFWKYKSKMYRSTSKAMRCVLSLSLPFCFGVW